MLLQPVGRKKCWLKPSLQQVLCERKGGEEGGGGREIRGSWRWVRVSGILDS